MKIMVYEARADERKELEETLRKALAFLNPGGRLVVIAFNYSEDKIVKDLFRDKPQHAPQTGGTDIFQLRHIYEQALLAFVLFFLLLHLSRITCRSSSFRLWRRCLWRLAWRQAFPWSPSSRRRGM